MRQPYRPVLEYLEDRLSPAVHTWSPSIFSLNHLWSNSLNWNGGVPTSGEAGGTIVQFGGNSDSTNNIASLVIDELHFTSGGNTVRGGTGTTLGISGTGNGMLNDAGNNIVDTTLPLSLVNGPGDILVSDGQLTLASAISGNHSLQVRGSATGALELAGAVTNTFTAGVGVIGCTLLLNNSLGAAIPSGILEIGSVSGGAGTAVVRWAQDHQIIQPVDVEINSDGQLDLNGHNETIASLTMTGGSVTMYSSSSANGKLTLTGDVVADSNAGTAASISGNLDLGTATRTFTVNNDGGGGVNLDISAVISGAAGVGLTKTGPGTALFDGISSNTYSGTTTVNDGTLQLRMDDHFFNVAHGVPAALVVGDGLGGLNTAVVRNLDLPGQLAATTQVTVNSDGLLDLGGNSNQVARLTLAGGGLIHGTFILGGDVTATSDSAGNAATIAANLDLGGAARAFTLNPGKGAVQLDVAGVISNGGMTKAASGTLRLSGATANTYTGATTVAAGTLVLNKSTGMAVPGDLSIGSANGAAGAALVRLTMPNQINPNSVVQIQDADRLDLNGLAQTIGQLKIIGTSFGFQQTTTADAAGAHTTYNFTIDGAATKTNAATVLGKVVVAGDGAANTATLVTNDTYMDANGKTQETPERISLGALANAGAGTLQKFDANGDPYIFLTLSNFATSYAYVGRNDRTVQLYGSTSADYNGFVSAGNYSYIAGPGLFHLAQGAPSVYGYSAGKATDFAYHYAANSGSAYVVSGTAFSYLSATDTVGGMVESFFNVGVGFLVNTGVAKNPGKDFAYIIDSAGNDTFVGLDAYSYMLNADGEDDAVYGFALVYAQSFVGGTDTSFNSAPARNLQNARWIQK